MANSDDSPNPNTEKSLIKDKINSIRQYNEQQSDDNLCLPRRSSFTDKLKIAKTDANFYKSAEPSPIKN
jgi:hypothetical protein